MVEEPPPILSSPTRSRHDGTLDKRGLRGRPEAQELAAADPYHDGTLTMDEYLAVVTALQRASVQYGTLEPGLNSKAEALLRLLK